MLGKIHFTDKKAEVVAINLNNPTVLAAMNFLYRMGSSTDNG